MSKGRPPTIVHSHPVTCACLGWGEFYMPRQDKFVPCTEQSVPGSSQAMAKTAPEVLAEGEQLRNKYAKPDPVTNMVLIDYDDYVQLINDQLALAALQAAGVDNWDFYDDALQGVEFIPT